MSNVKQGNPKDLIAVKKASLACVPAQVIAEIGVAMMEGRAKYGQYNWRIDGARASVYYDATMRHLFEWFDAGVDIDYDSGLSHITKAITSLVVLRDAMMNGMMTDDRPPSSKPFYPSLNASASKIIENYADKNPKHYVIGDNIETKYQPFPSFFDARKLYDDGWIEWNGGECPIKDDVSVEVKFRCGEIAKVLNPQQWRWHHHSVKSEDSEIEYDILAYRIIKIMAE